MVCNFSYAIPFHTAEGSTYLLHQLRRCLLWWGKQEKQVLLHLLECLVSDEVHDGF